MNYQTSALWFYSPRWFLITLLSLGCLFINHSGPLFYIIILGVGLPVIISMRLHRLEESGKAWLSKERNEWMVYVNGIPVQESRNSLRNPAFLSASRLRGFWLRCLSIRLLIQLAALCMVLWQSRNMPLLSFSTAAALLLVVIALWLTARTIQYLRAVHQQQWEVATQQNDDGTEWHQAFFRKGNKPEPAMSVLLSLP